MLLVFTTRRGVLVFYRSFCYSCKLSEAILRCSWFLRLEEEYWFSHGFYDSKRSIGFLKVFFLPEVMFFLPEVEMIFIRCYIEM